jgi:hypothetical protein
MGDLQEENRDGRGDTDNVSGVTRYSQAPVAFGDSAETQHANCGDSCRARVSVLCRTFLHAVRYEWASVSGTSRHVLYTATSRQYQNNKKTSARV